MTTASPNQWCYNPACPIAGPHYHDGTEPAPTMPIYDRDNLPEGEWCTFRKTALVRMIRIDGPFRVVTDEGPLTCQDGFVAMDQRGYPYPLAADEHALIYEPAEDSA